MPDQTVARDMSHPSVLTRLTRSIVFISLFPVLISVVTFLPLALVLIHFAHDLEKAAIFAGLAAIIAGIFWSGVLELMTRNSKLTMTSQENDL